MGVFLLFGAVMASIAGATLIIRGSAFDRMWALNPRAYNELAPLGRAVGIPFLLLGIALTLAGIGWFKRRYWGWQLAVVIVVIQVAGGFVHVFLGHVVQGGIGVTIPGALLYYLTRTNVRAAFRPGQ
jgi:hypothetical protein